MKKFSRGQQGITLIELLVAITIAALISVAAGMIIAQMFKINASSVNRVTAIRQVQNTGLWISRDVQSAQDVNISGGAGFSPLVMEWVAWDTTAYRIEYVVDDATLMRRYYINDNLSSENIVAQHVVLASIDDEDGTEIQELGIGIYSLKVKVTIEGFPWPITESRTYEILQRTG